MTKWTGLGISVYSTSDNPDPWELSDFFEDQIDDLLANGFTDIRIDIVVADNAEANVVSKAAVAIAVGKGVNVIWGVCFWSGGTLTAANWPAHRQLILDAALWAQNNGVSEFIIGNEEENCNDDTTLTDSQLRTNYRSLATDVQAIFTNGDIIYSYAWESRDEWASEGKGDIDLLGINFSIGGSGVFNDYWKSMLDDMVEGIGADGLIITEFEPSYVNLDDYSEDEAVQAAAVTEMIDYIKTTGIKRALFFNYYDDPQPFGPPGFGALKTNKTYRLLWQSLLNSGN